MERKVLQLIETLNNKMILELKKRNLLSNKIYEEAFKKVKRHLFTPVVWEQKEDNKWSKILLDKIAPQEDILKKIYIDFPVVIEVKMDDVVSTSSAPSVMAMMIENVNLAKGMNVLEIGTGSGYNAAILAEIVGSSDKVTTMENLKDIGLDAEKKLKEAGYPVKVILQDGGFGYPEKAPYDAIIVTTSCTDIPHPWFSQLKDGGDITLPLATRGKEALVKLKKTDKDKLEGVFTHYVYFLKMTGHSSIITHYYFDVKKFNSIIRLLKNYSEELPDFHEKLTNNLKERRERHDFEFYLSLVDKSAIALVWENKRSYGIWDKDIEKGGLILMFSDKTLGVAKENLIHRLEEYLQKFISLGKPKLSDYIIDVYPKEAKIDENKYTFIIPRKFSKTCIKLKKDLPNHITNLGTLANI